MNTQQGILDSKPGRQFRLVDIAPCETIVLKQRRKAPKLAFSAKKGLATEFLALRQHDTKKKQIQERLRHAQKMEAVGQLAGGVAHDFNNILMAIQMGLGLLRASPELRAGTVDSIREIEKETARAANLTRQLLIFTRRDPTHQEPVDVNALINDILVMLRRLLGDNIELSFQASLEPLWANADSGMIEQVILNLCLNARDAMPQGGRLMITSALRDATGPFDKPGPDEVSHRYVCLSVSDTGCGMDQAILDKIFEPFFTTKEVGKGTGLGLATVYGIVKQHRGWVEVDSIVGRGSSFRAVIPAIFPCGSAKVASLQPVAVGGSETILLVEDENSVRRLVAAWLQKLGYSVLEATNASDALILWERNRHKISLLFTDTMMPGSLTGLDLARRLKAEQPSLKVISSSGYDATLANPGLKTSEDTVYLSKPYSPETLATTVRQCLDNMGQFPKGL